MIAYINGLFAKTPAKLGNVRNSGIVQCPKSVLVERFNALFESYLNAICEQVVTCPPKISPAEM